MKKIIILPAVVLAFLFLIPGSVLALVNGNSETIVRFSKDVNIKRGEVVYGDVIVFNGDAIIAGKVQGNVVALGGDVKLKSTARITGQLTVLGGEIEREPGARIEGGIAGKGSIRPFTYNHRWYWSPTAWLGASLIANFLFFLGTLALGIVVVALLPDHTEKVALFITREPWQSIGVGFLAFLLVIPSMVALAITLIGIPLIPLFLLFVIVSFIYGYFAACLVIGKRIFEVAKSTSSSPFFEMIVGVIVVGILRFVPFIGGLLGFVVSLLGVGAVLLTKFGTGKPWIKRKEMLAN